MYKIYISSCAGLSFTGIEVGNEGEAKALCTKYNKQDNNPYVTHIYVKQ